MTYLPISDDQLEIAEGAAQKLADNDIRALILDLVMEIRQSREVMAITAQTYHGLRRQLLDSISGSQGAGSLLVVCRACRMTPAQCNDSGCGQRQEPGWRGELLEPAAEEDGPQLPSPVLDPAVLAALDPVLFTSLKSLERGARALEQYGLWTPPVLTEMITTLAGMVEQSTAATERPY